MALLEVKDIKKSFGKTDVLKGISFELQKGEVLAIIGSSGSGKTTLLRCLNYLEVPDNGKIVVNGERYSIPKRKPNIPKRISETSDFISVSFSSPSISFRSIR